MFASVLVALTLANVAWAQVSTASLLPIGFEGDELEGEVIGTGSDGTTFLLSGTFDTFSIPYTMTLVEDATHISENVAIQTSDFTLLIQNECGLSSGQVACTEALIADSSTSMFTVSGPAEFTGVPVLTASGTISRNSASSSSRTQVTVTGPSSGSALSTLPASIPISASPSSSSISSKSIVGGTPAVLPSPSNSNTSSSSSSASRNTLAGFGMAISAFLLTLMSI